MKQKGKALLARYERMVEAGEKLSSEDMAELLSWEATHIDGSGEVATSDWPRWSEFIDTSLGAKNL